jgi:hypothetical protein
MLPDTASWIFLNRNSYGYSMAEYYLRHCSYRDLPVIGVSYKQATKFCKWRSDRVMEFTLIKNGIIPHNVDPPKDSAFTIEKYFSGNYYNIKPSPYIRYYPVYSLPDSITYLKSIKFADSLNKINSKYCGKKSYAKNLFMIRCLENIPEKCDTLPYGIDPIKNTFCDYCKRPIIIDLLGNVRELTNVSGISFGGSYIDSCLTVKTKYFYDTKMETNAYTGFRNICTWRKWP